MSRRLWLPNTEGETHGKVTLMVGPAPDTAESGVKVKLVPGNEPEAGEELEVHTVPDDAIGDSREV